MAEAVRPQRRAKAKASRTKTKVRIPCHPPKTQGTVLSPLSSLGPQQQLYASPESSAYSAHTAQDLIPPCLDTRTVSVFSSLPCQTLSGARIFFFPLRSFRALPSPFSSGLYPPGSGFPPCSLALPSFVFASALFLFYNLGTFQSLSCERREETSPPGGECVLGQSFLDSEKADCSDVPFSS